MHGSETSFSHGRAFLIFLAGAATAGLIAFASQIGPSFAQQPNTDGAKASKAQSPERTKTNPATKNANPTKTAVDENGTSSSAGAKASVATASQEDPHLRPLDPQRLKYAYDSLWFYVLPLAIAVALLFVFLHFGRPDAVRNFQPFFGDGQVMQFVVIIAISGNIWSLAIAGVVGATEVAAIYGGIVGYVLGKKASA